MDSIAVRSCFVSHVEEGFDVSNFVHLRELDLMGNLLSSWGAVFGALASLTSLTKLHLNGNKLNDLDARECKDVAFSSLRVLVINSVGLRSGYASVKKLAGIFPNLIELYAAKNVFSDLVRDEVSWLK